ncbi:Pyridoxamine 5'-phosphate oxidase [Thermoplasmatales archaeon BRNA1]|nr:Pyridoxamine 5'-phosphate oxidase [Thermoplasmatales archaeon BRNA1]
MAAIPQKVLDLLNDPATVKVLVTASKGGRPHAIVAGTIAAPSPETMVIGEVLMKRASANLQANPKAAFLISKGTESYEINVRAKVRLTSGPELDGMNKVLAGMNLHAGAMWVFDVCCVCDEGAHPGAGTKIA